MVLGTVVAVFKPFLFLWAGLNLIDDLSLLIRMGRLAASVIPRPPIFGLRNRNRNDPTEMCGLCDDVIGDLMAGAEGISVIPCSATCLGIKSCIRMCEQVQEVSQTSTEFPCVAAGFCNPMDTDYMSVTSEADLDCTAGAFFSCVPKQYCRRKREGLKFKCELKPGIGRWNGMKHLAARHTVSLVEGFKNQLHCGEEGAGEFCIARPTGTGLIAEWIGHAVSLIFGGYKSIMAIESPGGNDDRQWLTFWLILSIFLFVERFCARVLLSNFRFYYECKLGFLIWLVRKNGADKCYRKLRKLLERWTEGWSLIYSDDEAAKISLDVFRKTGGQVVKNQLKAQMRMSKVMRKDHESKWAPNEYWEYDKGFEASWAVHPTKQLFELSKFLLSSEGSKQLEQSTDLSELKKSLLIERAAQVVSFQPRFLHVELMGTVDGIFGELPPMDANGLTDGYVTCRLVPEEGRQYPKKGVTSKTAFLTLSPQWNQELEIRLKGGELADDGFFYSGEVIETTHLQMHVFDADVGQWSWVYYISRTLLVGGAILVMAAYAEGAIDNITALQKQLGIVATVIVAVVYLISYYMAVMRRFDDELIGVCKVPLGILLDQGEHTVQMTIHPEKSYNLKRTNSVSGAGSVRGRRMSMSELEGKLRTNSVGGYGIIRAKLMLSEN